MINVTGTLNHLDIDTKSVHRAVETVRNLIGDDTNKATKLLKEITGLDCKFDNAAYSCKVVQKLVQDVINYGCEIGDAPTMLDVAKQYADQFVNNTDNAFMFVERENEAPLAKNETVSTTASGIDAVVKADGKFKKGEKGRVAAELYEKHVVKATNPMSNADFVAVLMKELMMSKAGANTYLHNLKKGK